GWGYVNADRAFNQRASVSLVSLAGTGPTSVKLWERTTASDTKATAVWNRHVSYQTGGMPSVVGLNNVDLRLYSRDTGDPRAASLSTIDNVEQVTFPTPEPEVLALTASTPFSATPETVALAHSGGFVARNGPGVSVVLAASNTVVPASTFVVTAFVTNTGDM